MGTNCTPLVADLFLLCYERDFMLSLSEILNLMLLKLSILLLSIWMTYFTLTMTSWSIVFTLQNFK